MPPAAGRRRTARSIRGPVGSMIPTAVARPDAEAGEPGGHRAHPPRQLAVGQLLGLAVARVVQDVPPVGMALGVPVEHLQQGPRAVRSRLAAAQAARPTRTPRPERPRGMRHGERLEEVARRLGRAQQILGEPHAERPSPAGRAAPPGRGCRTRGRAPERSRGRPREPGAAAAAPGRAPGRSPGRRQGPGLRIEFSRRSWQARRKSRHSVERVAPARLRPGRGVGHQRANMTCLRLGIRGIERRNRPQVL